MVDNISDALALVGAILIFVIALTVCMSSFTNMRNQMDDIIEYDSKLDLVTDQHGNLLNYHTSTSDVRDVGVEAVVSSMYRIVKENYVIYITNLPGIDITTLGHNGVTISKISDIPESAQQDYDTMNIVPLNQDIIKISISGDNSNIGQLLGDKGLYDVLKDKTFKEYLGVYQQKTSEDVDEINKTTYRVITYVVQ